MYLIHGGLFKHLRFHYFRRILARTQLTEGGRLLDYGCGSGDMLHACREQGIEAYGIDSSPRSVRLTEERGLDVVLGTCGDLPYPEGFFDVIFLQSVIEHVPDPVISLTALKRHARHGGLLIVSAPTPGGDFWDDPTHRRPHTAKSLRTLAELVGVEIIEINYVWSFLLRFRLQASFVYKLLNLLPFPTGSNLIAFFRVP